MKLNVVNLLDKEKQALTDCNSTARSQLVEMKLPITCRKTCNHCCTRQIKVTIVEGILLFSELRRTNKWAEVKKRIEAIPKSTMTLDEETYNRLRLMCPVNDPESKLCVGYKLRPAICSTFFSMSDPRACDPHYPGQIQRTNFINIPAYLKFQQILASRGFDVTQLVPLPFALTYAESVCEREFEDLDSFIRHLRPQ